MEGESPTLTLKISKTLRLFWNHYFKKLRSYKFMFINFWDCSVFPIFSHDSSFWRHFCGKREGSNSFSCIDLIFCNKQNLISNYGVDLSIFEKCHHNIIFGKINIHILLSPSYVCEVWNYSKTNIKNMQKAILIFDWKKAFENFSVDEKIKLLNAHYSAFSETTFLIKKSNLTIVNLRRWLIN